MTPRKVAALALFSALCWMVAAVMAAGDKVAFPERYAEGVLYWVQDRPADKPPQVREYFITPPALEAVRMGQPLPSGTVITVVQYNARLDPQGAPVLDGAGRFMKADVRGFTAMEKRTGWGAEYAPDVRNGEWEYQTFLTNRTPNPKANLTGCFTCHKKQESADFVFSVDNLKAAAATR